MHLHRLAEERSIACHGAIAERLQGEPEILDRARRRVETWLAAGDGGPFYSPFAGALRPRERWKIWRETRERISPRP